MDISLIEKAVYQYLAGASALTSLLADPDNVLLGRAPAGAGVSLPAVEIDVVSCIEDTERPRAVNMRVQVKGVADTAETASNIAAAIDSLLHNKVFGAADFGAPYNNFATYAVSHFLYPERTAHRVTWHAGGDYLLQVEET